MCLEFTSANRFYSMVFLTSRNVKKHILCFQLFPESAVGSGHGRFVIGPLKVTPEAAH